MNFCRKDTKRDNKDTICDRKDTKMNFDYSSHSLYHQKALQELFSNLQTSLTT